MTQICEKEFASIEYEQAPEDWRHRDALTWQLPTALVAGLAATLGLCSSIAFTQNMCRQHKSMTLLESLHGPQTNRVESVRWARVSCSASRG